MQASVQFSSVAQLCPTLCDPMNHSVPGLPVHHQLPDFTQTHVHQVGDAIQPSHPLSSPSPPAPNPSQHQGLFSWSVQSIGVSASTSVLPMNTQDWSISFRMEWLDLLAVQGTLKSLLQHHSSKASILRCSAFFKVQFSHPYMTTGETIALTRWTFVGKVINLLFNMLFQFSSVQALSHVWLFVTPWIAARQASLSITNSRSHTVHGENPMNTEVVCHSLLQWTTFCQTSPPWPAHLGWPHGHGLVSLS